MKNPLLFCVVIASFLPEFPLSAQTKGPENRVGNTVAADNPIIQVDQIRFQHSAEGNGYETVIYKSGMEEAGRATLRFATRANSTSLKDVFIINCSTAPSSYGNGNIGIGMSDPLAKFTVYQDLPLGTTAGNFTVLESLFGSCFNDRLKNSRWLMRDQNGDNWMTARLHDGISVNDVFLTPGADTRTWWERDPYDNLQSWGDLNNTYMVLKNGDLGVGWNAPAAKLHVHQSQPLGSAKGSATAIETLSGDAASSYVKNTQWLVRYKEGSDWLSTRWHDGLSVDNSYLTPGLDTRTWWERDPLQDCQSWGTGDASYVTLKNGKLGIGTENPQYALEAKGQIKSDSLAVEGTINAKEVIVTNTGWADFVFDPSYELPALEEVKAYVSVNRRLPGIPSEKEVATEGVGLGELNVRLLQKVEELTLYVIQLQEEIKELKKEK